MSLLHPRMIERGKVCKCICVHESMKWRGDVQKLVEIKVTRSVQVDEQHGVLQAAIKFQLVVLRTLRQSSCQLLEIKGAFDTTHEK